jgi:hypothetical protein
MKKLLLLAIALVGALLIDTPAQAQGPRGIGRPAIFKNSNGITIETEDDVTLVTSRLTQFLDSGSYQVHKHSYDGYGMRLVGLHPIVGAANTTLILEFNIVAKSKENPTTLIFVTGFYQKVGKKYPEIAVNDPKEEPTATVWAIEYKLATTYPDPLAKLWYRAANYKELAESQYYVTDFLKKY